MHGKLARSCAHSGLSSNWTPLLTLIPPLSLKKIHEDTYFPLTSLLQSFKVNKEVVGNRNTDLKWGEKVLSKTGLRHLPAL